MINFKRDSDNLIVAGNGPSLKNINSDLLPENFDVFRCNHCYLEDKYYIGNKIKLYGLQENRFYSLYKTIANVSINNDYYIDEILLSLREPSTIKLEQYKINQIRIEHMILNLDILKTNKHIDRYFNFLEQLGYYTSYGVALIMYGALLGYKNIYTVGIDFYKNLDYFYETNGKNIEQFGKPDFKLNKNAHWPNLESELKLITYLHKYYKENINFYDLSNNNILGKTPEVIISQEKNNFLNSIKFNCKKENYVDDIIIDESDIPKQKEPDPKLKTIERQIRRKIKKIFGVRKYQQY